MTTVNLGRIKPIYKGEYASGTTYEPLDFVSYGGISYFCILESTGNPPSDTTYWQLVADASVASAISYAPEGADAVATTVQTELRKTFRTSNFDTFAHAVIAASGETLIVDSNVPTDTYSVPADVALQVQFPYLITIATGQTLTINGSFIAGDYQVFDGTGSVSFTNPPSPTQVSWFGDLTTDFGVIMSRAIDSLRHPSPDYTSAKLRIPNGRFTATTPINASSLSGTPITIEQDSARNMNFGTIRITHNGVGLDCTGSPSLTFNNVNIEGGDDRYAPTIGSIPKVGILFARKDPGISNDCGYQKLNNVEMDGHFSVAAIYSYGSEVNTYINCTLNNLHANASTFKMVVSNTDSITSTFQTIATGPQSNSVANFFGGQVWSKGGGNSDCFYFYQAANVRVIGTFVNSYYGRSIIFADGLRDATFLGIRHEPASAAACTYFAYLTGDAQNISFRDIAESVIATTGYFIYQPDTATYLGSLTVENIIPSSVHQGSSVYAVYYPQITYNNKFTVRSLQYRGQITANPPVITSRQFGSATDLATGILSGVISNFTGLNTISGQTTSVANGASVDISVSIYVATIAYHISGANTSYQAGGLMLSDGSMNYTLFGGSAHGCTVTSPSAGVFRLTNNSGSVMYFDYSFTAIAKR